jgi:hypothetical protein
MHQCTPKLTFEANLACFPLFSFPMQLPPGWVEAKDPASGTPYFCNPATGESQWQRPRPAAPSPPAAAAAAPARPPWVTGTQPAVVGGPAVPAAAAEVATGEGQQGFIPSTTFAGARPGYVFKTGSQGVGYYVDKLGAGGSKAGVCCRRWEAG